MNTTDQKPAWIRPLLSELELLKQTEEIASNPQELWDELTQSNLLVRLREVAPLINKEAGHEFLYVQWFLPPQKVVCTFKLMRGRHECGMQLVLRRAGPVMIFYTKRRGAHGKGHKYNLYRYISGGRVTVKHRHVIKPSEVSDREIEAWFGYLLSGLQDNYRPSQAAAA